MGTKRDLVYEGLGFSVVLRNCPVTMVRGAEAPDIDLNKLMAQVFAMLIMFPMHLTGSHVRFIRSYLELSQKDFAKLLNQSGHSIVSTWESKKAEPTGMDFNTELILRQRMALHTRMIRPESLLEGFDIKDGTAKDPIEVNLDAA